MPNDEHMSLKTLIKFYLKLKKKGRILPDGQAAMRLHKLENRYYGKNNAS